MRIGVKLPNDSGPSREAIQRVAVAAEELEFDSVWIDAHVVVPARIGSYYPLAPDGLPRFRVDSPFADPFITLAFVAGVTSRLRLGTSVVPLLTTHPLALAKQAATLDVLSGGRAELGLGAGWLMEEATLLGHPTDHPSARLAESIDILRAAWRSGTFEWHGRYFDIPPAGIYPQPLQRDALPLWIGGIGDAAVRIAAQHNAGLLISRDSASRAADYRARLIAAGGCHGLGVSVALGDDLDIVRQSVYGLRDAGVDLVIVGGPYEGGKLIDRLGQFAAEVLPVA
jgi:probable F420-dependent oxidoreductase